MRSFPDRYQAAWGASATDISSATAIASDPDAGIASGICSFNSGSSAGDSRRYSRPKRGKVLMDCPDRPISSNFLRSDLTS